MTLNDGFDRTVSTWLAEQAGHGTPDYLDEILGATTRTRQRPAWSGLERWLPMQTTPASRRSHGSPGCCWWAFIAVLGVAALTIGSRHRQPAPPFGPARNGVILYGGTDNDIHNFDPVTGATTTLITGSAGDDRPLLSLEAPGSRSFGIAPPETRRRPAPADDHGGERRRQRSDR